MYNFLGDDIDQLSRDGLTELLEVSFLSSDVRVGPFSRNSLYTESNNNLTFCQLFLRGRVFNLSRLIVTWLMCI